MWPSADGRPFLKKWQHHPATLDRMTPIKKVCAWCQSHLGFVDGNGRLDFPVSHGLCPACKEKILAEMAAAE